MSKDTGFLMYCMGHDKNKILFNVYLKFSYWVFCALSGILVWTLTQSALSAWRKSSGDLAYEETKSHHIFSVTCKQT